SYPQGTADGSCTGAFRLHGVNHATIDTMSIINPFFGVELSNSNDVRVLNTFIKDTVGSNVAMVSGNKGLLIERCSFNAEKDSNIDLAGISIGTFSGSSGCFTDAPQATNYDFTLRNTQLYNSDILIESILFGARIDGVKSVINDPDYVFTNFQIGD